MTNPPSITDRILLTVEDVYLYSLILGLLVTAPIWRPFYLAIPWISVPEPDDDDFLFLPKEEE